MPGTGVRQIYSCPRCGKIVRSIPGVGSDYGSPLVDCPNCGETVLVCGIYESALITPEQRKFHEDAGVVAGTLAGALGVAAAIAAAAFVYYLVPLEPAARWVLAGTLILFMLGATYLVVWPRMRRRYEQMYARRREESRQRLADPDYRARLLRHLLRGIDSSDHFVVFYCIRAIGGLAEMGSEAILALSTLNHAAQLAPWPTEELNQLHRKHATEALARINAAAGSADKKEPR